MEQNTNEKRTQARVQEAQNIGERVSKLVGNGDVAPALQVVDGYNGKDKDGLYLAAAYGVATQIDQLDEKSPERKRLLNTLLNYCTNNCAYLNQE